MPFVKNGYGDVTYQATQYYAVECGGGGDCLFLSLAWLLNHYNVTGGPYQHGTLRTQASAGLVNWVTNNAVMPVNWLLEGTNQNILNLQLDNAAATALANRSVYGELGAVAAVVAWLWTQGRDVEVHVLDGTQLQASVLRSTNANVNNAPAARIHLYFESYVHYRALVPAGRINLVPANEVVANFGSMFATGGASGSGIRASLQSKSQSSKTTTVKIPAGTVLEIHHIDVGQGDATLVMIRDVNDVIRFSMLIDAGERQGGVTGYFDSLIKTGRFRPLDVFVASHPDKDHIADSKRVLDDPKYASDGVILYDNGTPPRSDREYLDVYQKNARAANRRRPPLEPDGYILNDFLGVSIQALCCNGVMRNGYDDKSDYWLHQDFGGYGRALGSKEFDPNGEQQIELSEYPVDKNDYSIALLITFGEFTYFTAGDLSESYEADIAYYVNVYHAPVTVWKAGHHGAQTSTSADVVSFLQGRFCVLSFGRNNGHGHPHQATLDHLESLSAHGVPCTYYCTGQAQADVSNQAKPGVLGKNGSDNRGTIIVRAKEADVAKGETFEVYTTSNTSKSNNGWETFNAVRKDPRVQNTQAKVDVSSSVGKKSKPLSEQQKKEKKRRREEREQDKQKDLADARDALEKAIFAQLKDDSDATEALKANLHGKDVETRKILDTYAKELAEMELEETAVKNRANKAVGQLRQRGKLTKSG